MRCAWLVVDVQLAMAGTMKSSPARGDFPCGCGASTTGRGGRGRAHEALLADDVQERRGRVAPSPGRVARRARHKKMSSTSAKRTFHRNLPRCRADRGTGPRHPPRGGEDSPTGARTRDPTSPDRPNAPQPHQRDHRSPPEPGAQRCPQRRRRMRRHGARGASRAWRRPRTSPRYEDTERDTRRSF